MWWCAARSHTQFEESDKERLLMEAVSLLRLSGARFEVDFPATTPFHFPLSLFFRSSSVYFKVVLDVVIVVLKMDNGGLWFT